jgi:DNA-binding NarL/FixJ family response regulator
VRVVLAEDFVLLREGLVRLLAETGADVVVSVADGPSLIPGTAVLVLSQYVEGAYADELLADGTGGVGYLLKARVADVDSFLTALEDVVAGGTVLDPQVVAQLFARRRADDPARRLTARKREVLGLIAEGHSNTAIARALVVTPGAVEKHTQHIFAKLGLMQDEDQHRRVMATLAYLRS